MKKIFYLFLILSNISIAQSNITVNYQLIHHYTISEINSILSSFGVPSVLLSPTFEVDYYKITYNTSNALGNGTTIATGAIAVPSNISCPLPIFSYQHGTTTIKNSVPSNRLGDEFKIGVIACSAKGSIVTMPDYLGLGGSPGFHPYINARTEASATIDLLRSCRELKDSIGYNLNNQLMLFGYSQGGHSTMATFKEIETNLSSEFTVTACAPMSGPYNVSGIQAQTIVDDIPYATPSYLPYVILGQQEAYGNLYTNLSDVFIHPYDSLLPLYFNGIRSTGYINNRVPDTPNRMLQPVLLNDFRNDPNHFFRVVLRDNDLHNWRPVAPLNMYYCTQDEQVFYQNSLIARDSMHALGATHVNAINVGPYTHAGCAQYCFIQGLFFFTNLGDWSGGMQIIDTIVNVTNSAANNGAIQLGVNNAVGTVTYDWEDGLPADFVPGIQGLSNGNYTVRISDSRGCYSFQTYNVGVNSSVEQLTDKSYFELNPNPASNFANIKVSQEITNSNYSLTITDISGKMIYHLEQLNDENINIDISGYLSGIYLITLENSKVKQTKKLVVE